MNLLNFGKKRGTHQFLEELFHNNYTPQITLPTRITDRSATLIDNIFLNTQLHKQTSGNITTSISDYLPQFTTLEKYLGTRDIIGKEQITYRDFKNFNELNLYLISRAWTGHMQPKAMMQTWALRSSSIFLISALINTPH